MKYGSKEHIEALEHESNTLAKRLSDAQDRIEALEDQKTKLVEALEAMQRRMATILKEVEGTEYAYVYDGVTGMVLGAAEYALEQACPEKQPTAAGAAHE